MPSSRASGCSTHDLINYRAYPEGTKVRTFTLDQYHAATMPLDRVARRLLAPPEVTEGQASSGEEKVYVDDAHEVRKFPDHFGTGTEDYYGWAGGVNPTRQDKFDHPFLANISVGSTAEDDTRGFNVCARMRGLDAIPFQQRLVFDMEASPGVDQRNPWDLLGYSAVTFWYALPGATSNRPADPAAAARPLMSLDTLTAQSRALREQRQR